METAKTWSGRRFTKSTTFVVLGTLWLVGSLLKVWHQIPKKDSVNVCITFMSWTVRKRYLLFLKIDGPEVLALVQGTKILLWSPVRIWTHCIRSTVCPKCTTIWVQKCCVMFKESKRLISRSFWIGTLLTWWIFSSKCKTFVETGIYQKHRPTPWHPMPELFASPGQQPWY